MLFVDSLSVEIRPWSLWDFSRETSIASDLLSEGNPRPETRHVSLLLGHHPVWSFSTKSKEAISMLQFDTHNLSLPGATTWWTVRLPSDLVSYQPLVGVGNWLGKHAGKDSFWNDSVQTLVTQNQAHGSTPCRDSLEWLAAPSLAGMWCWGPLVFAWWETNVFSDKSWGLWTRTAAKIQLVLVLPSLNL